jgi:hypothetical protein
MQRIMFVVILVALALVWETLLRLTLLAAEHSNMAIAIGFGVITAATSIFFCWYAVQGYRLVRSPLMVKHQWLYFNK